MTNEQHIENLKKLKSFHNGSYGADIDRAIKALEQPCEDAISRQAVVDMAGLSDWFDSSDSYNEFVFALSDLPPVNPQQKTGHWIYKQYGSYPEQGDYHCSECEGIDNRIPAYCPNCGAKMQEVEV